MTGTKSNERTGYVDETKTIPNGLENFFTTTTPLQISFLGSTRAPFAQLTWGLIGLKLFPIKGWVRKKYSFWIWGIFQLKMTWKGIERKWQGNAKGMKGTEKVWMDMRGDELKWKTMTIHKTTFPKLENFIYYPFPNYLSRFWAPMGYPLPKLTWSFNSFLLQEKVFIPKPPCCLWIWGFALQMARNEMKEIWNGHELDTKGKEISGQAVGGSMGWFYLMLGLVPVWWTTC